MKFLILLNLSFFLIINFPNKSTAQINWQNVDNQYAPLPNSMHVFFSSASLDGKPCRMYYCELVLKDKNLNFNVDTAKNRGFTPYQYFIKNNNPLLVVNCTFFSPNRENLNVIIQNGKLKALNVQAIFDKNTQNWNSVTRSALGINKRRKADVAWIFTDSAKMKAWQLPRDPAVLQSKTPVSSIKEFKKSNLPDNSKQIKRWRMKTAVGGGPSLISNGEIKITNNEELLFQGERINEKHPRTAIGYTKGGKLLILVIEGRFPGISEGATLVQEARILRQLGCIEALNLDGGGSSCMLINGKQTITPSDKSGQRAVPAVFMVK